MIQQMTEWTQALLYTSGFGSVIYIALQMYI